MPTETEQAFIDKFTNEGWKLYHNGFPDFICVKDSQAILVEVKANKHQELQQHQKVIATLLTEQNLKVYRWSPDCPELMLVDQIPLDQIPIIALGNKSINHRGKLSERLETNPKVVLTLMESGVSIKKIAEVAGISRQRVKQLIDKAKEGINV